MFTNWTNSTNATIQQVLESEPAYSRAIRTTMFGIIMFISLFGNIMVIYITLHNKYMRTFAYFLIANLAMADVGATVLLPLLVYYSETNRWVFGEVMCKLANPTVTVFFVVTTNTLVAIACDRFRALIFPFKLKPSTSETRLIIAIIWFLAFLVALPSYGSRVVTPDGYCMEIYTYNNRKDILYNKIYCTFMFLFNNLFPLLVILVVYGKITLTLKHIKLFPHSLHLNRSSSQAARESLSGEAARESVVLRNVNVAAANKRQIMEKKFIRMMLVVVLVFVFCYVPYQVFFLVWAYKDLNTVVTGKVMYYIVHCLHVLMWLPNAINPICYAALNERYAHALVHLLCSSFTRIKRLGTSVPDQSGNFTAASRRKSSPLSV